MTEAAASRDHRMEPVRAAELAAIKIDISILSPLERAENPLALQVGRHRALHHVQGPPGCALAAGGGATWLGHANFS